MTEIPEHILRRAEHAKKKAAESNGTLDEYYAQRELRLKRMAEELSNKYTFPPPRNPGHSARDTIRRAERLIARSQGQAFDQERQWNITLTRCGTLQWKWSVSKVIDNEEIPTHLSGTALTMTGARKKAEKAIRRKHI